MADTSQLHLPKDTFKMLKQRAKDEGKKIYRLADELLKPALRRRNKNGAKR